MKFRQLSIVILLLILSIVLLISAMSSQPDSSPQKAVNNFLIHLNDNEIELALQYLTVDETIPKSAVITILGNQALKFPLDLTFSEPVLLEQKGNTAYVDLTISTEPFGEHNCTVKLNYMKGSWKIATNAELIDLLSSYLSTQADSTSHKSDLQ